MHRITRSDISFIIQNYRKNKFGGTMTLIELAAKVGVSINTIQDIIHMRGKFEYLKTTNIGLEVLQSNEKTDASKEKIVAHNPDKPISENVRKKIEFENYLTPYDSYFMELQKSNAFIQNSQSTVSGLGLVHIQRVLIFAIRRDYLNWNKELTEEETYKRDFYGNKLYSEAGVKKNLFKQLPDKKDILEHIHLSRHIVKTYKDVQENELILPNKKGPGFDRVAQGNHCSCYYKWDLSNEFKHWLINNNFIFETPVKLRPFFQCYIGEQSIKTMVKEMKPKTLDNYI